MTNTRAPKDFFGAVLSYLLDTVRDTPMLAATASKGDMSHLQECLEACGQEEGNYSPSRSHRLEFNSPDNKFSLNINFSYNDWEDHNIRLDEQGNQWITYSDFVVSFNTSTSNLITSEAVTHMLSLFTTVANLRNQIAAFGDGVVVKRMYRTAAQVAEREAAVKQEKSTAQARRLVKDNMRSMRVGGTKRIEGEHGLTGVFKGLSFYDAPGKFFSLDCNSTHTCYLTRDA